MADEKARRDELVERLFSASLGMGEVLTVYLGDVLGLYRALERSGPMTAQDLATETGTFPRYAREWLEQQAAAGILDVDDVSLAPAERQYDLAIVVEAIHDLAQPVAVLSAIRAMLKPGGTLVVADERTEDSFTAPASEADRLFYAYSVLCCLPSAMDDETSAATGTVMRRSTFEEYARQAGFPAVSVLPIEQDLLRFYRLDR